MVPVVWEAGERGLAQKASLRQAIVIRLINLLIVLCQPIGSWSGPTVLETGLGGEATGKGISLAVPERSLQRKRALV